MTRIVKKLVLKIYWQNLKVCLFHASKIGIFSNFASIEAHFTTEYQIIPKSAISRKYAKKSGIFCYCGLACYINSCQYSPLPHGTLHSENGLLALKSWKIAKCHSCLHAISSSKCYVIVERKGKLEYIDKI